LHFKGHVSSGSKITSFDEIRYNLKDFDSINYIGISRNKLTSIKGLDGSSRRLAALTAQTD